MQKRITTITFSGQRFLFNAKAKLFVDDNFHSTHSTKNGFNVDVPFASEKITLKLVLTGMKSSIYKLEQFDNSKHYTIKLYLE